jgi:hypothetical protein
MTTTQTPPIPVGVATQAGRASALAEFILAVVAFADDRGDVSIAALVTATVTVVTVLAGRYVQSLKVPTTIAGGPTHGNP